MIESVKTWFQDWIINGIVEIFVTFIDVIALLAFYAAQIGGTALIGYYFATRDKRAVRIFVILIMTWWTCEGVRMCL